MALHRGNAWIFAVGPPEVNDTLIIDKLYFGDTRPIARDKLIEDVIEVNALLDEPYDLNDIDISIETIPNVPNWQP